MYADGDAARLEVVRAGWGQVEEFAEDQVDDTEGERSLYTYSLNVKEEIDSM